MSPKSPAHLNFAYFESAMVVEYFVGKYGIGTLKRMLVDLGAGLPINDSLARYSESLESLDRDFADYARQQARALAPDADWSEPELPRRATSEMIATWLKDHPHNYGGLSRLARQLINEGKNEAARQPLEEMQRLYPEDESSTGPFGLLADVYRNLKDDKSERAVLEKLADLSDDDVDTFARLIELSTKVEDWPAVKKRAAQWLAVNPLQSAPQKAAAQAAEALQDEALAIESYRALLLLNPFDPAEIHVKLAAALEGRGELHEAKRHALLALEETPRFRAAHTRLLAILRKLEENAEKSQQQ
jgi:tetratricopeptide (TPR) repeat protein